MESKLGLLQTISKEVRKQKSVFGLRRRVRIAYERIPWSAQGDPKTEGKNKLCVNINAFISTLHCKQSIPTYQIA